MGLAVGLKINCLATDSYNRRAPRPCFIQNMPVLGSNPASAFCR